MSEQKNVSTLIGKKIIYSTIYGKRAGTIVDATPGGYSVRDFKYKDIFIVPFYKSDISCNKIELVDDDFDFESWFQELVKAQNQKMLELQKTSKNPKKGFLKKLLGRG